MSLERVVHGPVQRRLIDFYRGHVLVGFVIKGAVGRGRARKTCWCSWVFRRSLPMQQHGSRKAAIARVEREA